MSRMSPGTARVQPGGVSTRACLQDMQGLIAASGVIACRAGGNCQQVQAAHSIRCPCYPREQSMGLNGQ